MRTGPAERRGLTVLSAATLGFASALRFLLMKPFLRGVVACMQLWLFTSYRAAATHALQHTRRLIIICPLSKLS